MLPKGIPFFHTIYIFPLSQSRSRNHKNSGIVLALNIAFLNVTLERMDSGQTERVLRRQTSSVLLFVKELQNAMGFWSWWLGKN